MITDIQASEFLAALPASVPALAALDGHVHPDIAPEGTTLPILVYQLAGGTHTSTLESAGEMELVYLLRIYAKSRAQASGLREALAGVLRGARIELGGTSVISDFDGFENGYEAKTGDYLATALWRLS